MREDRHAYWSKLISEPEASSSSIRSFCKQRGVSDHSFYQWRRRLRKEGPVKFALLKSVAGSATPIELFGEPVLLEH